MTACSPTAVAVGRAGRSLRSLSRPPLNGSIVMPDEERVTFVTFGRYFSPTVDAFRRRLWRRDFGRKRARFPSPVRHTTGAVLFAPGRRMAHLAAGSRSSRGHVLQGPVRRGRPALRDRSQVAIAARPAIWMVRRGMATWIFTMAPQDLTQAENDCAKSESMISSAAPTWTVYE